MRSPASSCDEPVVSSVPDRPQRTAAFQPVRRIPVTDWGPYSVSFEWKTPKAKSARVVYRAMKEYTMLLCRHPVRGHIGHIEDLSTSRSSVVNNMGKDWTVLQTRRYLYLVSTVCLRQSDTLKDFYPNVTTLRLGIWYRICLSSSLSVTFMHPTQPVEIFGNVSTPFCSPAI